MDPFSNGIDDEEAERQIRSMMSERRDRLREQEDHARRQSSLADAMRALKSASLAKQIRLLENSDPVLFKYIRDIELMRPGCRGCADSKSRGVADELGAMSAQLKTLRRNFTAVLDNMDARIEALAPEESPVIEPMDSAIVAPSASSAPIAASPGISPEIAISTRPTDLPVAEQIVIPVVERTNSDDLLG